MRPFRQSNDQREYCAEGRLMDQKPTVLVIEDHPEMRKAIVSLVSSACSIAGEVDNGNAALSTAQALHPNVILLDISLPGKSGLQILPECRTALPEAAIIMVTNNIEPVYREEAFNRGADGFVDKSRLSTELLPAISAALKARSTEVVQAI
jgi:DNA-binding NarL/FixJ family response regulator